MIKILICCLFVGFAWSQLTFIPGVAPSVSRAHVASAVVGTKIYFFTGVTDSYDGIQTASSQSFDTETRTWADLTDMPSPVRTACAVYDGDDRIYLFGGYDFAASDRFYWYTISSNSWKQADINIPQVGYSLACALDPTSGNITIVTGSPAAHFEYHIASGTFVQAAVPSGLIPGQNVYFNQDPYVVSGTSISQFSNDEWVVGTPREVAYYFSAIVPDESGFILFGGALETDDSSSGTTTVQRWNLANGQWTTLADQMPFSASGPVAARVGPSIYIFGGINETGLTTKEATIVACYYDECECDCDAETGLCKVCPGPTAPVAAPIAAPATAPAVAPSSGPTGPSAAPSKTPSTKTSSAQGLNALAHALFLASVTIGAVLY